MYQKMGIRYLPDKIQEVLDRLIKKFERPILCGRRQNTTGLPVDE